MLFNIHTSWDYYPNRKALKTSPSLKNLHRTNQIQNHIKHTPPTRRLQLFYPALSDLSNPRSEALPPSRIPRRPSNPAHPKKEALFIRNRLTDYPQHIATPGNNSKEGLPSLAGEKDSPVLFYTVVAIPSSALPSSAAQNDHSSQL